jgi:hypothetical protein
MFDDLPGGWDLVEKLLGRAASSLFLIENGLAQFDALATDVDVTWAFDERPHVAITLAAERTEGILLRGSAVAASAAGHHILT